MRAFTKALGFIVTIALTAMATITWANQPLEGQVITVCPQGPPTCQFSNIQEAINAAADGATIMIAPGLYREQELKISKNVNLVGPEPRLVQLITDQASIEGLIEVMIHGLTIHCLVSYQPVQVYEAKVTLVNVSITGGITVNVIEAETKQPKPSQLTLINVHIQGGRMIAALWLGPATEATVTESEIVGSEGDAVLVASAQLVMSRSLIKSNSPWKYNGLVVGGEAGVWLFNTQIEISSPFIDEYGPVGIVTIGGDLFLHGITVFSTKHGILIGNTARLHMEASQVAAIAGWGVSLVIEPCGVRLPPTADPSPQTFEGLVTGRQNKITGAKELGDVCPSELEFLKTPEGGQYP